MKLKGIDISEHQGKVDFEKVKNSGVDLVIIRAGYGHDISQKDPCFEANYKGAKAAGLKVGAYWYSYAVSAEDARTEAKVCLQVIKGKKFEYPIYFDLEEQSQFAKGRSFCDGLVKAFCSEIEKAGYFLGLYMSRSPLQSYISETVAKRYALWIAEYNDKCNYDGEFGIWQYSSSGKVGGISGNVDMNYCYVDYPAKIKEGGHNGYPKISKSANDKPMLDKAGYKKGDKGVGVLAVKEMFLIKNHKVDENDVFGEGTERVTNRFLKKWGYVQNGIIGENFIMKLAKELK